MDVQTYMTSLHLDSSVQHPSGALNKLVDQISSL